MIFIPTLVRSFPREDERKPDYTYLTGPKKEVVLTGNNAFDDFLASIQAKIGIMNNTATVLQKRAVVYQKKINNGDEKAVRDLQATEDDIKNKNEVIEALKTFFVMMKKDRSKVNDRVIGQVVWAPAITGNNAPHGYNSDVCVIKLDKKKFWSNFTGNIIDLGAC